MILVTLRRHAPVPSDAHTSTTDTVHVLPLEIALPLLRWSRLLVRNGYAFRSPAAVSLLFI